MNIVITLPHELAQAIYDGRKTIELRKNFPKDFDFKRNYIYICEKGTNAVTGFVECYDVKKTDNIADILGNYSKEICVDKEWLTKYLEPNKTYYLWMLCLGLKFHKPYSLKKVFNVNKPPQSFAYTDADWWDIKPWED